MENGIRVGKVEFTALDLGTSLPSQNRYAIPVETPREHAIVEDGEAVLVAFDVGQPQRLTLLMPAEAFLFTVSEWQKVARTLEDVGKSAHASDVQGFVTEGFLVEGSPVDDGALLRFRTPGGERATILSQAALKELHKRLGRYILGQQD